MPKTLTLAVIVCVAVAFATVARSATFIVNSSDDLVDSTPGDGLCVTAKRTCTLRAAILEANALAGGDTVLLPAGAYRLQLRGADEDAGFTGDLDITDDLVISGEGESTTIISGNHVDRVFDVHSPAQVTLSDMTVTNGQPPPALAARDYKNPDLRNDGGGLLNRATVTLTSVTFFRNRAGRGEGWAGGLANIGAATLTHVTFLHNRAGDAYCNRYGPYSCDEGLGEQAGCVGGMWNVGTAILTDVTFRANGAGDGGLGFGWPGHGGGMLNQGGAVLTDVMFSINRAGDGDYATNILDGTGGGFGGGMKNDGTALLTRVIFDRNRAGNGALAGDGGGMFNSGVARLTDVSFVGNRAGQSGFDGGRSGNGGGLFNDYAASVTINNGTFDRNGAGDFIRSTSVADCESGSGGGMYDAGTATMLTNVTMTRNRGGNTDCSELFPADVSNGGGLFTFSATLVNVTLALNRAGRLTYHGRARNSLGNQISGSARLINTIIFGPGQSCSSLDAGFVSLGHNLDSGSSCGLTAASDLSNTDPLLDKLKSNGGFTQTMALQPASWAIDGGDDAACPATDQRGVARPQGAACDIGAYEVGP